MSIKKIVTLSLISSISLYAAAYKLPTTSLNSNALSSAYVAASNGADSSYYNPANMVFNDDAHNAEFAFAYINIPQTKFSSALTPMPPAKSTIENVFIPYIHFASKDINGVRYGFSLVTPGGLSRRWSDPLPKASSEEFSAKIVELNPTIAYKIDPSFSIGGGLRVVYASGVVKSDSAALNAINPAVASGSRDMDGDTIELGYNLALTYKPLSDLSLGLTYRSNIDLDIDGGAKLYSSGVKFYDGGAKVSIPLPATLRLATAYKFLPTTTVEFVYERTYWSKYETIDFDYDTPMPEAFDAPIAKDFKDSNTYRIGLTHQYSDELKLMLAYAKDESPIPDSTLGFELPDSDADMVSTGFEYKIDDKKSFGLSYLYNKKRDRTVNNARTQGEFTDIKAHVVTAGYKINF